VHDNNNEYDAKNSSESDQSQDDVNMDEIAELMD
jgi:hypothetical protein